MIILDKVERVLREKEETRSNDRKLVIETYKVLGVNTDLSFSYIFGNSDLPSTESITRARRKLQTIYPELRAVEEVEVGRALKEEAYRKGHIC